MAATRVFELDWQLSDLERAERNRDRNLSLGIIPTETDYDAITDARSKIWQTPGVGELRTICEAEGAEFGSKWLGQQIAKLEVDGGWDHSQILRLSVTEFAAEVMKMRKQKPAKIEKVLVPVGGRKKSKAVANRRKIVYRLHDKRYTAGEIAAQLLTMKLQRKLPADLKVGVSVVESDIKRRDSVQK